jgi:NAD-dependent dihydropyrimidine dehydrogenase PreA subunit
MPEIKIDQNTCINCRICILTCPMGVYDDIGEHINVIRANECITCMGCVPACPVDSITIKE